VKPEIEIDFRELQIEVLVSITSVVERLRPIFFTELYRVLHVAENYGPFHVWYF